MDIITQLHKKQRLDNRGYYPRTTFWRGESRRTEWSEFTCLHTLLYLQGRNHVGLVVSREVADQLDAVLAL